MSGTSGGSGARSRGTVYPDEEFEDDLVPLVGTLEVRGVAGVAELHDAHAGDAFEALTDQRSGEEGVVRPGDSEHRDTQRLELGRLVAPFEQGDSGLEHRGGVGRGQLLVGEG